MKKYNYLSLKEFAKAVFVKVGVEEKSAQFVADILVDSNLRGVDTHGIFLCDLYVKRIQKGLINPKPDFKFEKRRASAGILDADMSLGQISTITAAQYAVELAKDTGVGIVCVINSNHFGAAAYYTEFIAKNNCIGILLSNSESDVVPFGGKEKFMGTNPLSVCVPAGEMPYFHMDMATSNVAFGKVRAKALAGEKIPPHWAVDKDGNPVTDPQKAYAVQPLGGVKGYALSLLIEILASRLTLMPIGPHIVRKFDDWENPARIGHFVQAIDIEAFISISDFKKGMDELFKELKKVPCAPKFNEILIPGEPELRTKQERIKTGCPVSDKDVELLTALGEKLNVKFPDAIS